MLNVLIPITKNAKDYNKLLESLNGIADAQVFVGVRESLVQELSLSESENVFVFKYDDKSKREEIVNALSENLQDGEVLILRKPITFEEFNNFYKSRADITVCEKKRSKINEFFHKIWQKILKLCLGVKLYEDIGAVLCKTHDLSFATRVDRWKGLETSVIGVKSEPVKSEVDKKSIISCVLTAVIALVISVVVTTCVAVFTKVVIFTGLLLFCLDAICLAIILIMLVMIGLNCEVGKKYNPKAVKVE